MECYMATTDIKSSPWRKGFSMENGKRRRNETILNTTVPLLPRELLRKHSYRPLSNLNTISIKILQYTNNSDRVKITMGNLHYTIPIKENSFFIFHLSGIFLLGLLTFRWSFCHLVGGDGRVGKVLMSLVICYGVEWIESWKVKKKTTRWIRLYARQRSSAEFWCLDDWTEYNAKKAPKKPVAEQLWASFSRSLTVIHVKWGHRHTKHL